MTQLVIGNKGEVGKALQEVLQCEGHDWQELLVGHFDIIHITIPFSNTFDKAVRDYQAQYNPGVTVIHSTVPVGTSRRLNAVHSPIHGIHNKAGGLVEGIKTFVKYIGAEKRGDAEAVLRMFQGRGIKGFIVDNPETSELSKLGCTRRHTNAIIEEKLFKQDCDSYKANFDQAYTQWNGHYSEGYRVLGLPYVQRTIIKHMDGPIGGHCCISNLDLLPGPLSDFLKEQNSKL